MNWTLWKILQGARSSRIMIFATNAFFEKKKFLLDWRRVVVDQIISWAAVFFAITTTKRFFGGSYKVSFKKFILLGVFHIFGGFSLLFSTFLGFFSVAGFQTAVLVPSKDPWPSKSRNLKTVFQVFFDKYCFRQLFEDGTVPDLWTFWSPGWW